MRLDYTSIIHFFFPPSEDERLLRSVTAESFASRSMIAHYVYTHVLLPYGDPCVKAAIHLNKYHYHHKAQTLLTQVLTQYLQTLPMHDIYIVPIPLSQQRFRKRGYNQTDEITSRATKNSTHLYNAPQLLKRTRDTRPQTSLTKKDRLQNMRDAFIVPVRHTHKLYDAHVVVVDDVTTTGSTLAAAKAALKIHNPASVTCIALAH